MIDEECGFYDTLDAQTALRVKDGTQRGLRDKNGAQDSAGRAQPPGVPVFGTAFSFRGRTYALHLKNRNTGYFRRADN
jgi:hypothetical protein